MLYVCFLEMLVLSVIFVFVVIIVIVVENKV